MTTEPEYTIGEGTRAFLRSKDRRLAPSSFIEYQRVMNFMVEDLGADTPIAKFEPPRGTDLLEEWLDSRWRETLHSYNRNLSVVKQLVKFLVGRQYLDRDPLLLTERKQPEKHSRSTFDEKTVRRILSTADNPRDRVALRLLLIYGLRKGALTNLQLMCFDHSRRMVTFKTKGRKYHAIPIAGEDVWRDVALVGGSPEHYLLHRRGHSELPMSPHGIHLWWYDLLEKAGVVDEGATSGQRMHKARHTAGQRLLDSTGNLKATQELLGHASIQTTGDVYAGWTAEQLRSQMEDIDINDEDASSSS
jgi:integrase